MKTLKTKKEGLDVKKQKKLTKKDNSRLRKEEPLTKRK